MLATIGRLTLSAPARAAVASAVMTAAWVLYSFKARALGLPAVEGDLAVVGSLVSIGVAGGLASGRLIDVPVTLLASVVSYGVAYWLVYAIDPTWPTGDLSGFQTLGVFAIAITGTAVPGHVGAALARGAWSRRGARRSGAG